MKKSYSKSENVKKTSIQQKLKQKTNKKSEMLEKFTTLVHENLGSYCSSLYTCFHQA